MLVISMIKTMTIYRYMPYYLIFLGLIALACVGIYVATHGPDVERSRLQPGKMKVAIILPGSIDDQSWSASGYNGLMLVKNEMGAQTAYTQNISAAQATDELRRYAQEGYEFIIAFGGEYAQAVETVAAEYPTVKFMATGAYPGNNRNLGTMGFIEEEGSFLAGAVAAFASRGKVAFIQGENLPHTQKTAEGFEQGARFVNKDIQTKVVFLGTWTDKEKGTQAGKALIAEKYDVIIVSADEAGRPVHDLAREAGIKTIGYVVDQYKIAPGTIITSMIADSSQLILKGAQLVAKGRWEGKRYRYGIREGTLRLADFRGSIDAEKIRKISEIRQALLDGLISPLPLVTSLPSTDSN